MLQRRLDSMFSSFAPGRFFNIGGPDSLNDFSPESASRGWEASVLFRCERSQHKHLFVVESCSPKLEQTFFTGMGKMDCGAGGVTFSCFFFLCLRVLICGIRLHNVSASSPKCFRKETPVLAKPDAQTEPKDPVVGLAPASRGGSCVRMGSAADANLFSKACPGPSLRIGG